MRVAVTGGSGTLGRALAALRLDWTYLSRADCDVRRIGSVYSALNLAHPDVVVHAAAITDHQHPNAAELIETNVSGTAHVARVCRHIGVPLVYLSTHYVYPGDHGGYSERHATRPIGAYAWSKYAGEQWVRAPLSSSLIVRGSWYDRATRLDVWASRGAINDAWCSREPVAEAARKVVALVEAQAWQRHGIVNIGGARRTFVRILQDEGYSGFQEMSRASFAKHCALPYAFPADVSVDTSRFEALMTHA